MTARIVDIQPLSPLLFRDGRPFGSGGEESRAQSLVVPLPHTLAGFMRTQIGNARAGWSWQSLKGLSDEQLHERLKQLHTLPICSVLRRDDTFMFPAPMNAVMDKPGRIYRALPQKVETPEGVNLPDGLSPLMLSPQPDSSFKPDGGYLYWTAEQMQAWLTGQNPSELRKVGGPPAEERVHVSIDPATYTGKDGALYTVVYRSFEETDEEGKHHSWTIRVKADVPDNLSPVSLLGGEQRPVALRLLEDDAANWPFKKHFPNVVEALRDETQQRLCFVLTTPALFQDGWKPRWLSQDTGSHTPRGVCVLRGKVELVGAAVGRRIPVSGWNLRDNAPKAVRWAVPAGSMFFLKVKKGEQLSAAEREKLLGAWLKPLSDEQIDQRDGFGCALWGVW